MPADVNVSSLQLEKFKCIKDVALDLDSINVLVGGNNSGKSSVLQGIHFGVCAAIASRVSQKDTFTQQSLLYCPAREFISLRHGEGYLNRSNFGYLRLWATTPENESAQYEVRIYRGRNEGNVGCIRSGTTSLGAIVASSTDLFSIYVPGLAGIPQTEEYRSEGVIRRGVAGGDANLYLRNVLLLIEQKGRVDRLIELMRTVFPGFGISVWFDPGNDVHIRVEVRHQSVGGSRRPLELSGTGVLQALQIFSYVTLFEPSLLLLDEPDAHLHPDNQGLLSAALQTIARETTTQLILSTHSRHLVEALQGDASFIWLKEGCVVSQGPDLDRLPLLLDLGALDSFDRLQAGEICQVILTEDSKLGLMQSLLAPAGINADETAIYSYKSSANLQAALALSEFIKDIKPDTRVIIHRDRDFMTEAEAQTVRERIEAAGALPFITAGSDLESYFLHPAHLSAVLDVSAEEVSTWLDEIATQHHNRLFHKFARKRDEIKYSLYSGRRDEVPPTLELLGGDIPLAVDKRMGKEMLKLVRSEMRSRFGVSPDPLAVTQHLACLELEHLSN